MNTLDIGGSKKYRPAEAKLAAELEIYLGKMERYQPANTNSGDRGVNPDFIITSGRYKGKTVDAMYTTTNLSQKEIDGINKGLPVGMAQGSEKRNIIKHLNKADFVPIDFRVLNSANRQAFLDYAKTLPPDQQRKFIIIREQ